MTHSGDAFRRSGTILTNGHNGRLIQYDALSFYINQGIRGTQVNGQVIGKHATKFFNILRVTKAGAENKSAYFTNHAQQRQGAKIICCGEN